jgi:hypothetical protein
MKIRGRYAILLLCTLIVALQAVSCSPSTTELLNDTNQHTPDIKVNNSEDLLSFYKENVNSVSPDDSSPQMKETEGLIYILEASFDSQSDIFIGNENKEYLVENYLFPENKYFFMTAGEWNKIISILFSAGDNSISARNYLSGYMENDLINRQDAVSSIMKVLASIPSITIEEDASALHKSYVLTDLDDLSEENQLLIRNAYCLGFTDLNIDSAKKFRPNDYLSRNDSVSILYRIFSNLGFPINKLTQNEDPSAATDTEPGGNSEELYSLEHIYTEYNNYLDNLFKRGKSSDKKKINMLNKAESILTKSTEIGSSSPVLSKENFTRLLSEVFGLDQKEVDQYLIHETDDAISFDGLAIIVFNSPKLLGQATPEEASQKALDEARAIIPQFDTAQDADSLSHMLSTGLINGIHEIPGFTPQRPVTNAEALIVIKRIVENMKIN